jgi:hypothetical protein
MVSRVIVILSPTTIPYAIPHWSSDTTGHQFRETYSVPALILDCISLLFHQSL